MAPPRILESFPFGPRPLPALSRYHRKSGFAHSMKEAPSEVSHTNGASLLSVYNDEFCGQFCLFLLLKVSRSAPDLAPEEGFGSVEFLIPRNGVIAATHSQPFKCTYSTRKFLVLFAKLLGVLQMFPEFSRDGYHSLIVGDC